MTLTPVLAPSWVTIDLDTTPPLLVIDAPSQVEPPDPWIVIVRANEDLGPVGMEFTDAYGTVSSVGYERIGQRTLAVSLPTVGLAGGGGELKVVAGDRACNAATATTTVLVLRPRAFDVTLTIDSGLAGEMTMSGAFDGEIGFEHAHDTQQSIDHAYEVESEIGQTLAATLEISDGE